MRVCKPNPQVLLHASQAPVVHTYAVQFDGSRDSPGLPTAPLSTSVSVAAADAVGTGDGGDSVVPGGGDDGAEGYEDGRVCGVGDGGVGWARGTRHKLHVCLQLALHT